MTLQNRVVPTGEIVADSAYRGAFMGNRGILHDDEGRLGTARWRHRGWVCCLLSFKGRRRVPMSPGRYTELFFLDEAVALAAGHRPCAECRRADFERFRTAWAQATGTTPRAPEMDRDLHRARVTRKREQLRHEAKMADLPDGTFVLHEGMTCLVLGKHLLPFRPDGYDARIKRPESRATVLTPVPAVEALRGGYRPAFHESAVAA